MIRNLSIDNKHPKHIYKGNTRHQLTRRRSLLPLSALSWPTRLSTRVLSGLSSTSPSRALTSPTLFSTCVFTCTIKRILFYVKGTMSHGLQLHLSSPDSIVTYTDVDWVGCPDTRCSTSGFCVYLGDKPVSWSSKRQRTVSRSSAVAE
jgi:hypothetical protein